MNRHWLLFRTTFSRPFWETPIKRTIRQGFTFWVTLGVGFSYWFSHETPTERSFASKIHFFQPGVITTTRRQNFFNFLNDLSIFRKLNYTRQALFEWVFLKLVIFESQSRKCTERGLKTRHASPPLCTLSHRTSHFYSKNIYFLEWYYIPNKQLLTRITEVWIWKSIDKQ